MLYCLKKQKKRTAPTTQKNNQTTKPTPVHKKKQAQTQASSSMKLSKSLKFIPAGFFWLPIISAQDHLCIMEYLQPSQLNSFWN